MNKINMSENYTVYKHTSPNGKVYIGITSQIPERRWDNGKGYRHNEFFWRAINKYGWGKFKHEIVYRNLNQMDAEIIEKQLIQEYNATNPLHGYNILSGGDATTGLSGELNGMYGVRLCGEKNPRYGVKLTDETKKKISEAKKGKHLSEEQKKKISAASSGVKNGMYGVHRYGKDNPFFGKTHSEQTKKKIREKRVGRYTGVNNPNARSIVCLTTNEVFESLADAVKKYGVLSGNLSKACSNSNRTCGKLEDGTRLKWQYHSDYLNKCMEGG